MLSNIINGRNGQAVGKEPNKCVRVFAGELGATLRAAAFSGCLACWNKFGAEALAQPASQGRVLLAEKNEFAFRAIEARQ